MDDGWTVFTWTVASGGFFGLLGAVFGALVGLYTWQDGRAAGSAAGLGVARAFARVAERRLTAGEHGLITGAVDGFLFLGVLGTLFGLVVATQAGPVGAVLGGVAVTVVWLAGGAVALGVLASGLRLGGVRGLALVFACSLGGALGGVRLAGPDGLFFGTLAGLVAGTALAAWSGSVFPAEPPGHRRGTGREESEEP